MLVPCSLSDKSSLPKVTGMAGQYSIRAIRIKVLKDKELRKNMVQAGYEQQKLFTWKKTIQDTIKLYNTVINNNVTPVK